MYRLLPHTVAFADHCAQVGKVVGQKGVMASHFFFIYQLGIAV